jgi:Gram-negative bacterial TonB protein C-terminal
MKPGEAPGMLATIPLGSLLAGVLRLAVPADRREEFLGDLIEEAHWRQARATLGDPAIWLWTQVLRSLPMLLGLRLRVLATGVWASPTPARPGGGLLVAARGNQRGWPVSLAVSVSAHALVVVAALGWLFTQVDEVQEMQPVRTPMDVLASIVADVSGAEPPPEATVGSIVASEDAAAPTRRARLVRRSRPSVSPQPAAAPQPGSELPGSAGVDTVKLTVQPPSVSNRVGIGGPVALPPRIAEKRCLTCPAPQLPPAYAHLARGQDMVIRTCVNSSGEVTSVNVLRGFDSTVNREVTSTVRHWRMVPYLLNGHPVPFCYATRFIFTSP